MGYGTSQRTKVHVVAVKREAYAKEKVKQIFFKNVCWGEGGRTEGGSGRACQDFLISSPAFGLSVTYIQYQHGKEKKTSIQFLLFPLSPLSHCVCFCEPKFSGLFFLLWENFCLWKRQHPFDCTHFKIQIYIIGCMQLEILKIVACPGRPEMF